MASLTKEDIRSVIETIKELYLEDMIPWICGYSGGKDSTAVVQLVWYALQELPQEKLKKTVHVISTDTLFFQPMDGSRLFDGRNVRTKLVLRFLSSAILKSASNFGIIILKSCSLQCVLHGAAKQPKAVGYTVTAVSAYFYKHEINHEEVAPCCQTRTPRTPIFSLLLIC